MPAVSPHIMTSDAAIVSMPWRHHSMWTPSYPMYGNSTLCMKWFVHQANAPGAFIVRHWSKCRWSIKRTSRKRRGTLRVVHKVQLSPPMVVSTGLTLQGSNRVNEVWYCHTSTTYCNGALRDQWVIKYHCQDDSSTIAFTVRDLVHWNYVTSENITHVCKSRKSLLIYVFATYMFLLIRHSLPCN